MVGQCLHYILAQYSRNQRTPLFPPPLHKGGHRGVLKKLTQKRNFYKVILYCAFKSAKGIFNVSFSNNNRLIITHVFFLLPTSRPLYYSLTRIGSILSCATIRYAKRKHANISSFSKKGYPSNTSSIVEPEASIPRICSTAIRIPLITGFPLKISGLYVMRSRRSSLFT